MKGVIFTEFLDMVDAGFSPETTERIIEIAAPANRGAYTAVGNYPASEMVSLVQALAQESDRPIDELLFAFGRYLLGRFAAVHGDYFREAGSTFRLLESVEDHIHVDVRKLDANAELPAFAWSHPGEDRMVMEYSSPRGLARLAEGLIAACIEHYGEPIDLSVESRSEDGTAARFVLERRAG